MAQDNERARDQARLQYESVQALIAAYELDWDRLEELRELKSRAEQVGNGDEDDPIISGGELDELAELEATAGDYEDQDAVHEAILNDPLSVQVRSDWHSPHEQGEDDEFQILLCTGGPAVRIVGELDEHKQADRAWIEYQDWFTKWERWNTTSDDTLCKYANHFLGY